MNNTNVDTTIIRGCGLSSSAVNWAKEHGSEFLRLRIEEDDFCRHRYNAERARLEAPGWSLLCEVIYPTLNPPAEAMELLSRGRKRFPQARLRQIFKRDCIEFVVVVDTPWPDGYRLVFDDRVRFFVDY